MTDSAFKLVDRRACGSCTLCCKLMNIPELDSPMGEWCRHCDPGRGCKIHPKRPQVCRDFFCGYLQSEHLSEEWYPLKSRLIVTVEESGFVLYVDPGRPEAWKQPPVYAQLKAWAREGLPRNRQVTVRIGKRTISVLPDKDVDLGNVEPGDQIEWEARRSPQGLVYSAHRVPKP